MVNTPPRARAARCGHFIDPHVVKSMLQMRKVPGLFTLRLASLRHSIVRERRLDPEDRSPVIGCLKFLGLGNNSNSPVPGRHFLEGGI